MNEQLEEFVEKLILSAKCCHPKEYFQADISWEAINDFAQAVADFTEKRVLEEIKEEIGISVDCEKCEELEARLALKRKQLEAFLPGGAVERLGEWAGRVLKVHIPAQDYLYENGREILAQ